MRKLVKEWGACDWFLCRYEYIEMGWVQLVFWGGGGGLGVLMMYVLFIISGTSSGIFPGTLASSFF